MSLPSSAIYQGDSAQWTYSDARLADGWTAALLLKLTTSTDPVSLSGSVSGEVATFTLSAAASAALPAGNVEWFVRLTSADTTEAETVGAGTFQVRPNPGVAGATSWARTQLGLVEDALAELYSADNGGKTSVSYLNTSYTRETGDQLMAIRTRLQQEVAQEERRALGKPASLLRWRRTSLTR